MDKTFAKWPINQNVELSKKFSLLKSLITYSSNLDKFQNFLNSKNIDFLDNLPEANLLIDEFNSKSFISFSTVGKYNSLLKAFLINDLFINDSSTYCNTQKIIQFFNQFNDDKSTIDDSWLIKAQELSQEFPLDFCISIPEFTTLDIISLLVNPITKEQGFIFNDLHVPKQLIDSFDNNLINTASDQISFEIFRIIKKYIEDNYTDIFNQYLQTVDNFPNLMIEIAKNEILLDIREIISQIYTVSHISLIIMSEPNKINLDFSDIENLNFNNFISYINQNPLKGFYICQYPETKDYFTKICELHQNDSNKNKKLPLSLFEFRIFIKFFKIQYNVSLKDVNILQDLPNLISTEIMSKIGKPNFQLSQLIGFLLEKVPPFIIDTFHTEYVRNFIINMISLTKNERIKKEIYEFIKQILPSIIDIIGNPVSISNINIVELIYNPNNNSITSLLSNPWRFVLQRVYEKIRPGYLKDLNDLNDNFASIENFIQLFTSNNSIEKLKECINDDLTFFKEKKLMPLYHEIRKNIVTEDDLYLKKIECSRHFKLFCENIDQFPQFNMSRESTPFESKFFYDDFYDFLCEKEDDLSIISPECEFIIAIIPKRINTKYVHTLTYANSIFRYHVSFKILGKVMLFRPPTGCSIDSLNIQSKTDDLRFILVNYIHNVPPANSSSIIDIQNSFNELNQCLTKFRNKQEYEQNSLFILKEINQAQILFGNSNLNDFIQKINVFKEESKSDFKDIFEKASFVNKFRTEILSLITISFHSNVQLSKKMPTPRETKKFLDGILNNSNLKLFTMRNISNLQNLPKNKDDLILFQELDNLLKMCFKLTLKPVDNKYNLNISNDDILKMKNDYSITPIIYIEENSLKVTVKSIDVKCDPLILGVDSQPFQMRLFNYTDDEIICEFQQTNSDNLPLPTYKNEVDFLVIEIPIENLTKNSDSNDIEFKFEGKILLKMKSNPILSTEIEYSITLHYVSLTIFIVMKNGHYFAVNNDKVEIVPFSINPNSKLIFEKFYDQKNCQSKFIDKVTQINSNDLINPELSINQDKTNKQVLHIATDFSNIINDKQNSNISMNFEFGLPNEKSLITSFQTDMISQMTLAIYSDETQNFEKENIVINIGNLTRKVYFIVEAFNNDSQNLAQITNATIISNDRDNLIYHYNFNPNKNNNSIQPNKFGQVICFFEARYCGPIPFPNHNDNYIDCCLNVEFQRKTQTINFKYKIQTIQINEQNIKYTGDTNYYYYYNIDKKTFVNCNNKLEEIQSTNSTFRNFENQILISPFSYSLFSKNNSNSKIVYDINKGIISKILNNHQNSVEYEIFGYFVEQQKFMTISINDPKNICQNNKDIYLLARIKNKPKTFFTLFCPIKGKNNAQFNLFNTNIELKYVFPYFATFFTNLLNNRDLRYRRNCIIKSLHHLFYSYELNNLHTFSYLIRFIGKIRKTIQFRRVIKSIVKFTNCYEIEDHFNQIVNKYGKTNKDVRFYSFISVLNELINDRYNHFQETQFYIQFPIDFNIILKQQKIILNELIKENKMIICKYFLESHSKMKALNKFEQTKIKEFKDKGFIITSVIKWNEKNGIEASNINELKSYQKIKPKPFIKDVKIKNIFEPKKLNLLDFPEKITIESFYSKFNEIFKLEYYLPPTINKLIENRNFDLVRNILNQLFTLYNWQNESSFCFPFYTLKSKYSEMFSSILSFLNININQFNESNIQSPIINQNLNNFDFIQIPKLGYEPDEEDDSNENHNESNNNNENDSNHNESNNNNENDLNNEYDEVGDYDYDDENNTSKYDKNKVSKTENENKKMDDEENDKEDAIEKVDDEDDEEYDENDKEDAIEKADDDEEYDENDIEDAIEKVDDDEEYDENDKNDAIEKDNIETENDDVNDDEEQNKNEDEVEEEEVYDIDDEDYSDEEKGKTVNVDFHMNDHEGFEEDFEEEEFEEDINENDPKYSIDYDSDAYLSMSKKHKNDFY